MENKHEIDKEPIRTIGDNLKNILEERSVTGTKLAKLTGLDASYIYDIIKNKKANPSIKIVIKISKVLNVDIDKLLYKVDFD
ncbi:hypothetical protein SDC9_95646 [bioreactor metagenome]|uniref:HTH cro/C1-type domain-containing protein n=1 Tax=bioreactor metagenome TaxID=1076179 RepID=A0A645A6X7_9ZZZZ